MQPLAPANHFSRLIVIAQLLIFFFFFCNSKILQYVDYNLIPRLSCVSRNEANIDLKLWMIVLICLYMYACSHGNKMLFSSTLFICSFQQDGLLNFDKHRKAFEILVQLTLYQKAAANYSFPHHLPLERWLSETPLLSEQKR